MGLHTTLHPFGCLDDLMPSWCHRNLDRDNALSRLESCWIWIRRRPAQYAYPLSQRTPSWPWSISSRPLLVRRKTGC